jgi:hypothetical protein
MNVSARNCKFLGLFLSKNPLDVPDVWKGEARLGKSRKAAAKFCIRGGQQVYAALELPERRRVCKPDSTPLAAVGYPERAADKFRRARLALDAPVIQGCQVAFKAEFAFGVPGMDKLRRSLPTGAEKTCCEAIREYFYI